jgi:hypothetical protein
MGTFSIDARPGFIHVDRYADYFLRAVTPGGGVGDIVATGEKVSLCMVDSAAYDRNLPGAPATSQIRSCSGPDHGISVGWADVYPDWMDMQWVDVTGVPNGTYWLELTLDPDNVILESNENNNTTRIMVDLQYVPEPSAAASALLSLAILGIAIPRRTRAAAR